MDGNQEMGLLLEKVRVTAPFFYKMGEGFRFYKRRVRNPYYRTISRKSNEGRRLSDRCGVRVYNRLEDTMSRREIREHIFKLLFRIEFNTKAEMPEQIRLYFEAEENQNLEEASQEEIEEKYEDIIADIIQLDARINEAAEGWSTSRMGKVELTILRLACYEMDYDENIPTGVAINEAVELAKKFGGEDAPSFVNGILAKMVREG